MTAIFYYCSYTCTLQIIIAVFHLYICFWFRIIRFHSFGGGWAIFLVTTVMLKDQQTVDQGST